MAEVGFILSGEIDLANRDELERRLDVLMRFCDDDIAVDCRALTFIDSSGIGALAEARNRLYEQGRTLRLVAPPTCLRRVVQILGLENFFLVEDAALAVT